MIERKEKAEADPYGMTARKARTTVSAAAIEGALHCAAHERVSPVGMTSLV
jgi:hypothetical protein